MSDRLYTKMGEPLIVQGGDVFDKSGRQVGRRSGNKIYAPNGKYAGTVVGDTVVYRSTDAAERVLHFVAVRRPASPMINRPATPITGTEPFQDQ